MSKRGYIGKTSLGRFASSIIEKKDVYCWKEKDFDKAYHSAKQRIDKKGSELFQEVNRQIKLQG